MPIGERIKALRSEQRWSQGDLATKIGADPGQISRYENGQIAPSADAIVRLADVLDVSDRLPRADGAPRQVLEGHNLGKPSGTGSRTSPNSVRSRPRGRQSGHRRPHREEPDSRSSPGASPDQTPGAPELLRLGVRDQSEIEARRLDIPAVVVGRGTPLGA